MFHLLCLSFLRLRVLRGFLAQGDWSSRIYVQDIIKDEPLVVLYRNQVKVQSTKSKCIWGWIFWNSLKIRAQLSIASTLDGGLICRPKWNYPKNGSFRRSTISVWTEIWSTYNNNVPLFPNIEEWPSTWECQSFTPVCLNYLTSQTRTDPGEIHKNNPSR